MPREIAIAVLGCKHTHARGAPPGGRRRDAARPAAFLRRVTTGARAYAALAAQGPAVLVASGGRAWGGVVEADAIADELVRRGVPREAIVRERCSHSTRENASFSAEVLRRRDVREVHLVTCDWHMARARRHFEAAGLVVHPFAAPSPALVGARGRVRRVVRAGREWVAARLVLFALVALTAFVLGAGASGCKPHASAPDAGDDGSTASPGGDPIHALALAEDRRATSQVDVASRTSHDVALRRRATRALARIADEAALPSLLRALSDEDPETAAWGAYGLGFACKGHEPAHVAALAARGVAIPDGAVVSAASGIDLRLAIARAIGHCAAAAPAAEPTLTAWLRARPGWAAPASLALGDVAARRGDLKDDTMSALLDAASGAPGRAPLAVALFAFGRLKGVREPFAARALTTAKASLATPGPDRIFAVRALGRAGDAAAPELVPIVVGKGTFTPAERGEAARALGSTEAGRRAAADAIVALAASKDELAPAAIRGDELNVLLAVLGAQLAEVPSSAEKALYALASAAPPADPKPTPADDRRFARLRCAAALALAKGSYDTEVLAKCAPHDSEIYASARLEAVLRRPLLAERQHVWAELAASKFLRVREAAIDALGTHPEAGDAGRAAVVRALGAKEAGLVATAADLLSAHPDRALTVSDRDRRAALDPSAPAPSGAPDKQVDPATATALAKALTHPWSEDLVETRLALLDAAAALGLPQTKAAAKVACGDANVTVRAKAKKILGTLGDGSACAAPASPPAPAAEIAAPPPSPATVTFTTDAGARVTLHIDAADVDLAPVTAARILGLARSGFYEGIVIHRVVPGFVAQLGDPGGDGYGGSGKGLRCETAPVAFGPHDIGIALAGRDTGSSQIFVTLSATPHLDGEYTRIGHADGALDALAEGDVIDEVTVGAP